MPLLVVAGLAPAFRLAMYVGIRRICAEGKL